MRRLAILKVTPDFLVMMGKPGKQSIEVIANALPVDAHVAGQAAYDLRAGCFLIVVESESFADVPEGAPLPELEAPRFERLEL